MGIRPGRGIALVAALAALAAPPAPARAARVCLEDLPADLLRAIRVPLGCELVDCCPGCPAGAALDARIRLGGEAVRGATLVLRGGGRPEEKRTLGRGETRLGAVAGARAERRLREARLALELDPAAVERWNARAESVPAGTALGTVSVAVEQLLGPVVVNALALDWSVVACGAPEPCDRIEQTNNAGGDVSAILLDGRRLPGSGGCRDDLLWRSASTADVGNVRRPAGCRSEVAVFSAGDEMVFLEEESRWKDTCGDVIPVALEPALDVPVKVWIAVSPLESALWWGEVDPGKVVKEDFANAVQIYDENKTGIGFTSDPTPVDPEDWRAIFQVLEDTPVLDLLLQPDLVSGVCSLPSDLEEIGFYKAGQINVYYLPLPFTGMICDDDRNVIFVGLVKKPATLAHELGHSFSLLGPGGHSNDVAGLDATNVMWVRESTPRDHLSLGQAFRQNLDFDSMLNVNGVRQGYQRSCPPLLESPECPKLGLDWRP